MDTSIMMYVYVRGGERGCEGCVCVKIVCVVCVCVLCAHLIVDPVYSCSYILKNHLIRDQHIPTLHTLAQLQPLLHPAHIHTTHVFLVEYGRVW